MFFELPFLTFLVRVLPAKPTLHDQCSCLVHSIANSFCFLQNTRSASALTLPPTAPLKLLKPGLLRILPSHFHCTPWQPQYHYPYYTICQVTPLQRCSRFIRTDNSCIFLLQLLVRSYIFCSSIIYLTSSKAIKLFNASFSNSVGESYVPVSIHLK